jgi:NAD(P)H-hydrate epimerase
MASPILTISQMREWERASWAIGQTEPEVMRRVGLVVASRALALTRPGDTILIVAGKGHNGDDARLAQPHLPRRSVQVLNLSDPKNDLPALDLALKSRPNLVIDGLFGIGLNRALDDDWKKVIQTINEARLDVLSIDVPSGLNADTGEPQGDAIRATRTLSVGAPKVGFTTAASWPFVGRLEVASEIGLAPCASQTDLKWTLAKEFTNFPPARPIAGHKGSFGHLSIVAGSMGYHGAAVIATRGAQQAMPGLVTTYPMESVYPWVAGQIQSAMVSPWKSPSKFGEYSTAILFGPGLAAPDLPGALKGDLGRFWYEGPMPMVADASGLDWLPTGTARTSAARVMTPHPGEAARLLKASTTTVLANRPSALRELSRRWGNCWVVLKGHQTMIGRSTGEIYFNPSGNPKLAQGGSGDVLSGYLAGLLAQPPLQGDPLTTIRYAVWQHGAAADALSARQTAWTIDDLIPMLGQIAP